MSRLLRWAFNSSAAVSAVLLVGVCALWVRSYWRADRVDLLAKGSAYRQTPLWMTAVILARGGLGVSVLHGTSYYPDDASWRLAVDRPTAKPLRHQSRAGGAYPRWTSHGESSEWRWRGFQWLRRVTTAPDSWAVQRSIVAPYWVVGLMTAALPALWLRRRLLLRRAARRSRAGLCPSCGYDMRATPGRCPECGTVPAKETAT
jgi:hypothetical protein